MGSNAPETGWLPRRLRALERRMGADREGRTLWIWAVPASTVAVSFAVMTYLGVQGSVDWGLTIPMALTLALFLGTLSAIYLTAASSDERDADDDDRGDDGRVTGGDAGPPPGGAEAPRTVVIPVPRPDPAGAREQREQDAPRQPVGR